MIQLDHSPDPVIPVCIQGSDSYTKFCARGSSLIRFNDREFSPYDGEIIWKEEMQVHGPMHGIELNETALPETEFSAEHNRALGKTTILYV